MIRFTQLEALGLRVAAMTERADGDCRDPGPGSARAACCAALGISEPEALTCGRQVHGVSVAVIGAEDRGRGGLAWDTALPATDGLITAVPGLPLAVFVADCAPVYFFAPNGGVAGLLHAGREGTRGRIVAVAAHLLGERFGVTPKDIHALIGPSAGPERYEVSEAIAAEWAGAGLPRKGRTLDLWEANRAQLRQAGVPESQIHVAGMCTIGDARFFSYRRGDAAARSMAVLMI